MKTWMVPAVLGVLFSLSFATVASATDWHEGDTCIYGNGDSGQEWLRSCPDTVCHKVHNHPLPTSTCDMEDICLPHGTNPNSTFAPCMTADQQATIDQVDPTGTAFGQTCTDWVDMNSTCINGGALSTRNCSRHGDNYPTQMCQ